jgi:transglutaminase-like putative cysteine protease
MIKLVDILFGKTSKFYDKVKTAFFPLLLAVLSLTASLYVFSGDLITRYTVGGAIWCTFLFILFSVLPRAKIKIIKPLVHIVLLLLSLNLPLFVIGDFGRNRINIYNFVVWFFSGAELQPTAPEYLFGFAFAAGYFFSFTLWYFTSRVYRKQIIFLVSLMPYVIFIKAVVSIPYGFVILSVAFNLFIFLQKTRENVERGGTVAGRQNMFTVYGDFAIALVLLVFIIPKPAATPYYEQFQEVLNNYQFGNFGSSDNTYGRFNTRSGNADEFNRSQLRDLYYAAMETPDYLKIQAFPYYDAEGNFWYVPPDYNTEWYRTNLGWENAAELHSYSLLAAGLLTANELSPGFAEKWGIESDLETLSEIAETEDDRLYSATIEAVDFPAQYIAAPSRTVSANNSRSAFEQLRLGGGLFTQTEMSAYARTEILYYSEDYIKSSGWLNLEIADSPDYRNILSDAADIVEEQGGEADVFRVFLAEDIYADSFLPDVWNDGYYYSEQIAALSAEITAPYDTEYDKALALERYFKDAGFEYVLGFEPPIGEDTAEYFLFESKTGTCSDFATAYCLMAQYAGLTVRYSEGYIPVSTPDLPESFTATITNTAEQFFIVTSDNAHAYPEVYIGGGWMRFEPTVGSLTSPYRASSSDDGGETDPIVILAIILAVLIAAAGFVVFLILLPTLRELWFAIVVRLKKPESALRDVYLRTGDYISENRRTMTAGELSEMALSKYNSDITPITIPFVNYLFGGEQITREVIDSAYKAYGQFKKDIKAAKKRMRRDRRSGNS